MKTAKSLGLKKGDFVLTGLGFPGFLSQDAHTATPFIEVFGVAHESGSCYAHSLTKISIDEFITIAASFGHSHLEEVAYSPLLKKALKERRK